MKFMMNELGDQRMFLHPTLFRSSLYTVNAISVYQNNSKQNIYVSEIPEYRALAMLKKILQILDQHQPCIGMKRMPRDNSLNKTYFPFKDKFIHKQ